MIKDIYWERQRGDNCRIHSLNAYFGYCKISETEFYSMCDEYDKLIPGLKSRSMDGFSEARCIISYILSQIGDSHSILIPMNKYQNARSHINVDRYQKLVNTNRITSYFEFNAGHVWLNKFIKDKNIWVKIDSISGVNPIDPRINYNQNGIILVINDKKILGEEMIFYIKQLSGDKIKDELNLFNLYHSINIFNKIKDENSVYVNLINMKKFLDDFVVEKRKLLLKSIT